MIISILILLLLTLLSVGAAALTGEDWYGVLSMLWLAIAIIILAIAPIDGRWIIKKGQEIVVDGRIYKIEGVYADTVLVPLDSIEFR